MSALRRLQRWLPLILGLGLLMVIVVPVLAGMWILSARRENQLKGSPPYYTWTLDNRILLVAITPDGQWIAAMDENGRVHLLNAHDTSLQQMLVDRPNGNPTQWPLDQGLAFSSDGHLLASTTGDSPDQFWKIPEGTLLTEPYTDTGAHKTVAFGPDNQTMAMVGYTDAIDLWQTGGEHKVVAPTFDASQEKQVIRILKFSDNGQELAALDDVPTLYRWDTATGRLLHMQQAPYTQNTIHNGAISPVGDLVASVYGGMYGITYLWRAADGSTIKQIECNLCWSLAFSPDGHQLAIGDGGTRIDTDFWLVDSVIHIWTVPDGSAQISLAGHTGDVNSMAWSQDGHWLVSGSNDKTVRLWHVDK